MVALSRLTTPVSYISTVLKDPFAERYGLSDGDMRRDYIYKSYHCSQTADDIYEKCYVMGYTWSVMTKGPSRENLGNVAQRVYKARDEGPRVYDSTNGTISTGYIIRTNKGVLLTPGN